MWGRKAGPTGDAEMWRETKDEAGAGFRGEGRGGMERMEEEKMDGRWMGWNGMGWMVTECSTEKQTNERCGGGRTRTGTGTVQGCRRKGGLAWVDGWSLGWGAEGADRREATS